MKIVFTLLMLLSLEVLAGHQKNGGSAIVCFQDVSKETLLNIKKSVKDNLGDPLSFVSSKQIESVTTTDIYISSLEKKEGLERYKEASSDEEVLNLLYKKLDGFQDRLALIIPYIQENEIIWEYVNRPVWSSLDGDPRLIRYPSNCVHMYVAIHDYLGENLSRVYIDQRLYKKMDYLSRASLKLHEILLRRSDSATSNSTFNVQNMVDFLFTFNERETTAIDIWMMAIENSISYFYARRDIEVLSGSVHFPNYIGQASHYPYLIKAMVTLQIKDLKEYNWEDLDLYVIDGSLENDFEEFEVKTSQPGGTPGRYSNRIQTYYGVIDFRSLDLPREKAQDIYFELRHGKEVLYRFY